MPLRVALGVAITCGLAWLVVSLPPRATGQQSRPDPETPTLASVEAPMEVPREVPREAVGEAQGDAHGEAHGGGHMSEAAMQRWSQAWWGSHRPVGASSHQVQSATFTVQNFRFDTDLNAGTQVDTAKISIGQSVLWTWVNGGHTITNGSGTGDPGAGTLFDQPMDLTHQQFSFTFNTAGTFPFFCRPHELSTMKGVVVVSPTAGVPPGTTGPLGFTSDPSPNPTRSGVTFAFALRAAGRCRADVFDARGRRAAVVLDEDLLPGPHAGTWDGRTLAGVRAAAGLYYLRLMLPGYAGSRAIAITR